MTVLLQNNCKIKPINQMYELTFFVSLSYHWRINYVSLLKHVYKSSFNTCWVPFYVFVSVGAMRGTKSTRHNYFNLSSSSSGGRNKTIQKALRTTQQIQVESSENSEVWEGISVWETERCHVRADTGQIEGEGRKVSPDLSTECVWGALLGSGGKV